MWSPTQHNPTLPPPPPLTVYQIEGLLEYQVMPSLCDVAHICPRPGPVVWSVRAGGMDRPSHTKSHPVGSLSSSHPGGPPCKVSPLAFGLIALYIHILTVIRGHIYSRYYSNMGLGGGGGLKKTKNQKRPQKRV
jgi:hypothetical protein